MKALLRGLVRLLGGYELYRVFARERQSAAPALAPGWTMRPIDGAARGHLAGEAEAKPRQLATMAMPSGAMMFALWNGAALLAVALYEPLIGIAAIWPHGPEEALALTDL